MTEEKRGISNRGIVQILVHFHLGHFRISYVKKFLRAHLPTPRLRFQGWTSFSASGDSPHFLGDDEDALFDGARSTGRNCILISLSASASAAAHLSPSPASTWHYWHFEMFGGCHVLKTLPQHANNSPKHSCCEYIEYTKIILSCVVYDSQCYFSHNKCIQLFFSNVFQFLESDITCAPWAWL